MPIRIGSISLRGFEVPTSVSFGGKQRLVVHKLSDGRRIVEPLGPDDDDLTFRGIFTGRSAVTDARAFDELRLSGETVWLSWGTFGQRVIVKIFRAKFQSPWWIPYQLVCTKVDQPQFGIPFGIIAAALLPSDIASTIAAAGHLGVSVEDLRSTLTGPTPLVPGTSSQVQASLYARAASAIINEKIATSSAQLGTLPAKSPGNRGRVSAHLNNLACAEALAWATQARSYLGRIQATIGARE